MKKYVFLFFVLFFSISFGFAFAEDCLISQITTIRAGNLTFQLPAGFKKDTIMYRRQLDGYKFDSIQIQAYPKNSSFSDEQTLSYLKETNSKIGEQLEEVNINGKNVLFQKSVSGASAYFCENGLLYMIIYINMDNNDYNSAKSFIMNIIRTAR